MVGESDHPAGVGEPRAHRPGAEVRARPGLLPPARGIEVGQTSWPGLDPVLHLRRRAARRRPRTPELRRETRRSDHAGRRQRRAAGDTHCADRTRRRRATARMNPVPRPTGRGDRTTVPARWNPAPGTRTSRRRIPNHAAVRRTGRSTRSRTRPAYARRSSRTAPARPARSSDRGGCRGSRTARFVGVAGAVLAASPRLAPAE